jgi:hypothetical protein
MGMQQLSRAGFEQARSFIAAHARPLEQALFAFWFEGAEAAAVVRALQPYQNEDGGFGHGLEPDFLLADSSPLATTVALQYLGFLGLPPEDGTVRAAMEYLLGALDPHQLRWPAVPAAVNDAPHAPWWHVDPETGRCSVEGTWANPSAEIVSYLWRYAQWVPTPFRDRLTDKALAELRGAPFPIDLHDFLCWARLGAVLPGAPGEEVVARLGESVLQTVDPNASSWASYGAEPLALAPGPDALFAGELADLIAENLDYRIASRAQDGGWWPNWEWNQYPDDWEAARRAWAGIQTVHALKSLRDFGRL